VAKARPIEGLTEEEPYVAAGSRVVSVRAAELREHADNVLDLSDVERLHDMRVATRRLRAALEIFGQRSGAFFCHNQRKAPGPIRPLVSLQT
jgi:CHAD domain-containing protein